MSTLTFTNAKGKEQALAGLRNLPGILPAPPKQEVLAHPLAPEGIPRAGLTELRGPAGGGKAEAALGLLAAHPQLRAAWLEEKMEAYPPAFEQLGVSCKRVLFVETGAHLAWSALQVLRSGLFGVVVLGGGVFTEPILRRLQLAAEAANCACLILAGQPLPSGAWTLSRRLGVKRSLRLYSPDPIRVSNYGFNS